MINAEGSSDVCVPTLISLSSLSKYTMKVYSHYYRSNTIVYRLFNQNYSYEMLINIKFDLNNFASILDPHQIFPVEWNSNFFYMV